MFIKCRHKIAAYFVTSAIVVFLAAKPASAAVTGFVVRDNNDGKYYEYNYEELLDSYTLSVLGMDSKLFSHYRTKATQAFLDDKKGYVDYADVIDAYTLAVISGQSFNVNQYTESGKAKAAQLPAKATEVKESAGQLVFIEKNLDPLVNALDALNKATNLPSVAAILTEKAAILGLDLTDYLAINQYGQNYVAQQIIDNHPALGYKTAKEVQDIFAQNVAKIKNQLQTALAEINNAATQEALELAIRNNAAALELDITKFDNLPQDTRSLVLGKVLAEKPFSSFKEFSDYFNSAAVNFGKNIIISYTNYGHTLKEIMDIQMGLNPPPQTDLYGGGWKNATREDAQYYVDPRNFFTSDIPEVKQGFITIEVSADAYLRVRQEPNTGSSELTRVYRDETYQVLDTYDDGNVIWYKIQARGLTGWVYGGYVRLSGQAYTREMLQFLALSGSANVPEEEMAKILKGKGILDSKEKAFLQGATANNINEVFLVSLALHESGNGTSLLATGIQFPDVDNLFGGGTVTVYNMFGIGALDSNPNYYGAERAYKERWFTPEAAIIGGAKFAASNYINNPTYQQNTLYKMRWNPANPGAHQYATDMGWAVKQTSGLKELYDQLSSFTMQFDIPKFKE